VPELPEVEVVRAGLERHVVGARVVAVDVLHERPVRRDPRGPEGFALALAGRTITGASRRTTAPKRGSFTCMVPITLIWRSPLRAIQ